MNCSAKTKSGKPCRARATANGKCSLHSDPLRAAQLARKARKNRYQRDEAETATVVLTAERLDAELVKAVCAPMMPGLAMAKIAALEIAYARLGISVKPAEASSSAATHATLPPIYNPIFEMLKERKKGSPSGSGVQSTGVTNTNEIPTGTPLDMNERIYQTLQAEGLVRAR